MIRILYYFLELGTNMYQWQRIHIIDELIRHNIQIDTINPLLFSSFDEANDAIVSKLKTNTYNLFFTNICSSKILYKNTLQELKHFGIPSMTIRCDNIVTPYEDRTLAPYFDLVWLTSSETKRLYDNWKVNSIFAPYAANPYTFKFCADNLIKKVCFVGTPYGSRTRMINKLTVSGINVDLYYGQRQSDVQEKFQSSLKLKPENNVKSVLFHRLFFKEGRQYLSGTIINKLRGHINLIENPHLTHFQSVNPSEIYKYYSNYSLALSSTSAGHTDILKKPLKIINLRNFEIPMSGGIQICRYNEELARYFEPDKEIVFYDSETELLAKAKYLLEKAPDSNLRRLKTNARRRAESEHTWYARFLTMFNVLGIKV